MVENKSSYKVKKLTKPYSPPVSAYISDRISCAASDLQYLFLSDHRNAGNG